MHRVRLLAGFIVLTAVVAAAWTIVEVESVARATIQRPLTETREAWEAFQASHYRTLRRGVRVLANDAAFKAAVAYGDQPTVFDMLKEKGRDLGADFVLATNASGQLIARTDRSGAAGNDLSQDPLVIRPLQGEESAGAWQERDTLFHAVSVPMSTGPELLGVLIAGYGINQALANDLGKITRSHVAFFVGAPGAALRLLASSLDKGEGDLTVAPQLAAASSEPFEVELGGKRQVGIQVPLKSAAGQTVGSVVFLRNPAEEKAPFARLRTGTLVASLVVIALSLAVYVTAARTGR